jgi:ribonuclease HI
MSPAELGKQIIIRDIAGLKKIIPQLRTDESQKLLGVMKNPIGNQQDEIKRLKAKSNRIAVQINTNALTTLQAKMAYESFYIPAMRYSLPITSINQMDLNTVQAKAMASLLATMGYNRHMPREVVYCSTKYQGLGMKHLYDIQGVESTRLLIQELNNDSVISEMIKCLLETIQLEAGIGKPILEENRTLIYIEWGWIPSIRDFLLHIQASITNATEQPETYREFDSFIMDAKLLIELTRKEQILINRCRLYLQVECVSDISNAEGNKIRTEWLRGDTQKDSQSLKKWPAQGDPGEEAWRIWRLFIERSFTTTDGSLHQPLGQWTQTNWYRRHLAYYHHRNKQLWYYSNTLKWTIHEILQEGRRNFFFDRNSTSEGKIPPDEATPIDIIEENDQTIITGKAARKTSPMNRTASTKTLSQIIQAKADQSLYHNVTFKEDEEELQYLLSNKAYIDIATDGSFDKNTGISSYGWVMAINTTVVATGSGPAEAHPTMAEPFRAEAYGLAAAAAFIQEMCTYYCAHYDEHIWHCYIDNKSLIQNMEQLRLETPSAKWNLSPDADILKLTHNILAEIPINFVHIKGHQDKHEGKSISFSAQLNVMADELAVRQRQTMNLPMLQVSTPNAHLQINDITITRDSQKWLMDHASRIPIQEYYYNKHKWNMATFSKVDWDAQHKVLLRLDINDQRRILKFVHGWLPTYDRLYREKQTRSPRCPLCHYLVETNMHMFQCCHPSQQAIVNEMQQKILNEPGMGNHTTTKWILRKITNGADDDHKIQATEKAKKSESKFYEDQEAIGWQHIYFGRIAATLAKVSINNGQDDTNNEESCGDKWTKRLIGIIWNTTLQLWKNRNGIIYNTEQENQAERKRERLAERVARCYEYQDHLQISDREKIFTRDKNQLMKEEPRFIKAWIKIAEGIIKIAKNEKNKQSQERNMMETYFQWQPHNPTPRKKRRRSGHRHKQDLRPD